ncbi:MAG: Molybdate-binding protein, partial [Actinobacteria bacterium]|nr:Molybdate-binding protein [Actinomycetota bacterium]
AVGTAAWLVLLAVEGDGAVTAPPRRHLHPRFIDEHWPIVTSGPALLPGRAPAGARSWQDPPVKLVRPVAVPLRRVLVGALLGALLGGCTSAHKAAHPAPSPSASAVSAGTVVLLASTQLRPAFDQLATQFAAAHPGVTLTATYQGSQALATAVQAGTQGDVFATETDPMAALVTAGAVVSATVQTFARNELEIVVPVGNPKGIQGLADLARPGVTVVLADPALLAGRDAIAALALAGVRVNPKSTVPAVALLMTTVLSGNADAGIAFHSDVVAGGSGVTGVALPAGNGVDETYRIAVLRNAPNAASAGAFVQFVRSEAGRAILTAAGFVPSG